VFNVANNFTHQSSITGEGGAVTNITLCKVMITFIFLTDRR